jgi:hypothetical protein
MLHDEGKSGSATSQPKPIEFIIIIAVRGANRGTAFEDTIDRLNISSG